MRVDPSNVGVAILGVGTIGGEVARRLIADDAIAGRFTFVGALDRGPEVAERAGISADLISTSGAEVVDRADVQIVVETLGGEQPATDLMIRALAQGKHVVTANKEAVAKNFSAIVSAARDGGSGLLFEASVGGGIPLLVSLRQVLASNQVTQIRGIMNGTTNFILHKMESQGTDYQSALQEAQDLGYAEPDPTADIEGYDAAYKIAILASMMTGRHVHPDSVDRSGISSVSLDNMRDAQSRGGTIRLIASAAREGDDLKLKVAPTFIDGSDLFSRVIENYNAIEIVGDRLGPVWLHGQGAGPSPTASAILSDIAEVAVSGASVTPDIR